VNGEIEKKEKNIQNSKKDFFTTNI
jgi:hypothetical protein